ncbi:hypothetical protein PIB30_080488 [Stylosanthes scabra]|uniref:Uncharacterized protein n=1 Tax=Stylosanthes scabra TaxID=79078 RepID=A0ABU6WR72_9FABA|nr:hypothetical protein [Stylosanthes scabra]
MASGKSQHKTPLPQLYPLIPSKLSTSGRNRTCTVLFALPERAHHLAATGYNIAHIASACSQMHQVASLAGSPTNEKSIYRHPEMHRNILEGDGALPMEDKTYGFQDAIFPQRRL